MSKKESSPQVKKTDEHFQLSSPEKNTVHTLGDEIPISISPNSTIRPDSIVLVVAGIEQKLLPKSDLDFNWNTMAVGVGRKSLRLLIYYNDSLKEIHSTQVTILSNIEPKELKYKVLRKFAHDEKAFTQGLIFHDKSLFESTGQRGFSSLRKVNPKNGSVEKIYNFEDQYFGEGIALIGDEIFMLTWTSQLGFVFDLNTFELKRKFNLQTSQGWGLTTNGESLILSDGSSRIYYYHPESFTQTKQLDICDNVGLINQLNELEYNSRGIFANILGEDFIIVIDPISGLVKEKLNLKALTPPDLPQDGNIVLNGIAYNRDTDTYYITGKYWPVMYEIKILN